MLGHETEHILMALIRAFKTMDQRCYAAVKEDNLTKNEAIILMFLSNNKQYDTASDIIRIRSISKAHVCQSIDHLCKKGYLSTSSDEKDHRIQHLKIESSANKIVEKLNNERSKFLTTLFEGIDDKQKEQFVCIVKSLIHNTEKGRD